MLIRSRADGTIVAIKMILMSTVQAQQQRDP